MKTDVEHGAEKSGPVALSFGQIEAILADLHSIASDKRVAFAGRLKALQRNKLPVGERPGRGKAAEFNYLQFLQFAIGIELMRAGVAPAPAAQTVRANWGILRHSIGYAFWKMINEKQEEEVSSVMGWPLDLSWLVWVNDFRELARFSYPDSLDVGGIEAVQSRTLAGALSRARYVKNSGRADTAILIRGGSVITATLTEVIQRQFASFGAIFDEILDPATVVPGLKPSTPPWSVEATEFFDAQTDPHVIDRGAENFVELAPRHVHYVLRDLVAVDMEISKLDPIRLRNLPALVDWHIIDISDDGEYTLTRLGRRATEIMKERGHWHVDPEA